MTGWDATRDRVEHYFDRTATETWARLTSDAPVSRIRATVRAGRGEMRALMLSRLPADLTGRHILDAGCGAGQMTEALARRGAQVTAVDISPSLVGIARERLPLSLAGQVRFATGDMRDPALGHFDHVIAMDSLLYYGAADLGAALTALSARTRSSFLFTVAPRTALLMAFWTLGRMFPQRDRSPVMVPHALREVSRLTDGRARHVGRVARGFYISDCHEVPA